MHKLFRFILKVRQSRNDELGALFGHPEEVQGCLEENETPASGPVVHAGWGHCPHCEKLQTVAGGILWWQGHQPQDRLPVVATFPRPEPLWLFFSGVIWRIGSTVNHQQLYWNWRTQSSIMWINWETMLSSRDVWLGNSRRGLECAWTGRAATLSTCSDVLMTHPHSAESNVLLIVCFKAFYLIFIKTRLMLTHVCSFLFQVFSFLFCWKVFAFPELPLFFKSLAFPQFSRYGGNILSLPA